MRNGSAWVVGVVAVVMSWSTTAWAQDPSMSPEQIRLLNEANKTLGQAEPDLSSARGLLEEALEKGERFDILLLSLGRTMQKMDECRDAVNLFNEMGFAPHEPSVSRADLKRLKDRYVSQMGALCSAWLTVTCVDPETSLELSTKPLVCGDSVKLSPGGYELAATLGEEQRTYPISLSGAQEMSFNVGLSRSEAGAELDDPKDVPDPEPPGQGEGESFRYGGTVAAGVTTLVLTGASVGIWAYSGAQVDGILTSDYVRTGEDGERVWVDDLPADWEDRQQQAQPWGTAELYAGWAVPVVAGVGLVATTLLFVSESDDGGEAPQVSIEVDPLGRGAYGRVSVRW